MGGIRSNSAVANGPIGALIHVGLISSTQINRALLGFDLSPLPTRATVTTASLSVQGSSSYAFSVELEELLHSPQNANWTNNSNPNSNVDEPLSTLNVTAAAGTETWISVQVLFPLCRVRLILARRIIIDRSHVGFSRCGNRPGETHGTSEYLALSDEGVLLENPIALLWRSAIRLRLPPVIASVVGGLTVDAYVQYNFAVNAINGGTSLFSRRPSCRPIY